MVGIISVQLAFLVVVILSPTSSLSCPTDFRDDAIKTPKRLLAFGEGFSDPRLTQLAGTSNIFLTHKKVQVGLTNEQKKAHNVGPTNELRTSF